MNILLNKAWLSATYGEANQKIVYIPTMFEASYVKKLAMFGQSSLLGINMVLKEFGEALSGDNLTTVELVTIEQLGSRKIVSVDHLI